jgi:hypothetical protein
LDAHQITNSLQHPFWYGTHVQFLGKYIIIFKFV